MHRSEDSVNPSCPYTGGTLGGEPAREVVRSLQLPAFGQRGRADQDQRGRTIGQASGADSHSGMPGTGEKLEKWHLSSSARHSRSCLASSCTASLGRSMSTWWSSSKAIWRQRGEEVPQRELRLVPPAGQHARKYQTC